MYLQLLVGGEEFAKIPYEKILGYTVDKGFVVVHHDNGHSKLKVNNPYKFITTIDAYRQTDKPIHMEIGENNLQSTTGGQDVSSS